MGSSRDIRRLAFQALFELDARGGALADAQSVRDGLESSAELSPADRQAAFDLAAGAFEARDVADREFHGLAPSWPAHRQPAVDRAILRLAHYELCSGRGSGKMVINDAVELAKEFSTDRSPAFVNGLLDKVLKRVQGQRDAAAGATPAEPGQG